MSKKGNIIHLKYSSGLEMRYEYDEKGNKIHYLIISGRE